MSLLKKVSPAKYDRADADNLTDAINNTHISVKAPAYGALGNDTGNDGPAIQAAVNAVPVAGGVVYLPPGTYRVLSAIVFPTDRQVRLVGAGPVATTIHVTAATIANPGTIHLRGSEFHSSVEDLGMRFDQPDSAIRTNFTAYLPAIYAVGTSRFRLRNLRIVGAWNGIKMTGDCGGSVITDLTMASYNIGIEIDGSLESVRLLNIYHAPYTATANQTTAFLDFNNIGLSSARCDDLHVENFSSRAGAAMSFVAGGTGITTGHLVGCFFNGRNGLLIRAGALDVTGCSFVSDVASYGVAFLNAASDIVVVMTGCRFYGPFASAQPLVSIVATGGSTSSLAITSCSFVTLGLDRTAVSAVATASTISLSLADNIFYRSTNVAYTRPTVTIDGARASVSKNKMYDKGTGAGTFLQVLSGSVTATENTVLGWVLDYTAAVQSWGNITPVVSGVNRELWSGLGFVQASGYEALSFAPPAAYRVFSGTLDGAGAATVAHGLTNGNTRVLSCDAGFKGAGNAWIKMSDVLVGITSIVALGSGTAGANFRITRAGTREMP